METIYVLGCGAIGFPLAACLVHAGRRVIAVRTSTDRVLESATTIRVDHAGGSTSSTINTVSLARLNRLDGLLVIAAKAHANQVLAQALRDRHVTGPIIVMQNGVGVEEPLLAALPSEVYRCALYATSEPSSQRDFTFCAVTASPVGIVRGTGAGLARCVRQLSTAVFPLRRERDIQRETWKKSIINVVFNSICPLLDIDNGVLARDAATASLARRLVDECLGVTDRLGIPLEAGALMEQIAAISRRSEGRLISTLQDIRRGRPTEMPYLNLEIVRIASSLEPAVRLPRVELLGSLVMVKSAQTRTAQVRRAVDACAAPTAA